VCQRFRFSNLQLGSITSVAILDMISCVVVTLWMMSNSLKHSDKVRLPAVEQPRVSIRTDMYQCQRKAYDTTLH
jgi:hypothetical protein